MRTPPVQALLRSLPDMSRLAVKTELTAAGAHCAYAASEMHVMTALSKYVAQFM